MEESHYVDGAVFRKNVAHKAMAGEENAWVPLLLFLPWSFFCECVGYLSRIFPP